MDAIKHAFIINVTDYSSVRVVYLLILDPEDKPGSSPDIKKYDYLITGHNVGEIPQERIQLHWLNWLTVLYLRKMIDRSLRDGRELLRVRAPETNQTLKCCRIPTSTSIYTSKTAEFNSDENVFRS